MKIEMTVDENLAVGPYTDMYGHGPVISIQKREEQEIEECRWVCLDCGYSCIDSRILLHEDCEREKNQVNQTMRELVEEEGYPE